MKNSSNMSRSKLSPYFALSLVLKVFLVLTICHPFNAIAAEPVFSDGFEAIPTHLQLDCKREGYPCSLAEADPDALDRVLALLMECWDVRRAGNMDDVRSFLENETDVIDIGGNLRYISFRVEGMMPVIFDDVTTMLSSPPTTIQPSKQSMKGFVLNVNDIDNPTEVVGDDSNGDGKIDQKDIKRALVLAPFEWQFAPFDESTDLTALLQTLRPFAGNVVFKGNPNVDDTNITIDDWLDFDDFDVIAVATHGSKECQVQPDLSNLCEVWISGGIVQDFLNPVLTTLTGVSVVLSYDDDTAVTPTSGDLTMYLDFWRDNYGGTLENKLVTFSACETGNAEGGALAAAMGGDDFIMGGWTEVVPSDVAFKTTLAFYDELTKGLAAREAFDNVADLGLFPALNSASILTSFEVFSPNDDDVRIIELPRLMFDGETMMDGINIHELVTGTIADQSADSLTLTLQIDGVTADSKSEFQVRYRIDNQDVPGAFDLNSATLIDNNYRYEVVHDIPLGFPLMGGDLPIEVIVDLPEGGDSRFSVNAFLASCYFTASVSGDTSAFFDGPAQFEIGMDDSINFTLRNRANINADPANSIFASFSTGPSTPLVPGIYNINSASLSLPNPIYSARYTPGFQGADCPSCGGSVNIETLAEGMSTSGSVDVTMVRIFPPPENGELPTVQMEIDFVAAFGSQYVGSSPYVKCSILYADD